MANIPQKVAVIGLDGLPINLLDHHVKAGDMPTLKRLIESGMIAANSLSVYPTITPPNWTSIATGAWPGTHTVLDFWVHRSGQPLDVAHCPQAFSSNNSKAEYLWDTLDKAGKKCIVLNYPVAWPSHMKNGIMVGGYGMAVGQQNDQIPAFDAVVSVTGNQLFTTGYYLRAVHGEWKPADGWKNATDLGEDPLEMACQLNYLQAIEQPAPVTWYALACQTGKKGYDTVTLSPTRDMKDAFCTLREGQWSGTIRTQLEMADGRRKEVSFVCKLIELSEDADDFRLYLSGLLCLDDCCNPPEVARQIKSNGLAGSELISLLTDWFGLSTWLEVNDLYTQWHAETAVTLLTQNEWDAFFMHYHSPDWAYHFFMNTMDQALTPDKKINEEAWAAHLRMVQAIDRLLEQITAALPKNTLIVIVSDHGEVPDGPSFDPYKALVPAGLARLDQGPQKGLEESKAVKSLKHEVVTEVAFVAAIEFMESFAAKADIKNTKAVPLQTSYIYINLKGRDPDGIVDPADYENVQRQIIDALYTYVDPESGKRPVALALTRQDARILGLWGEDCGDVVYATYADVGQGHGNILPTGDWGVGTIRNVLVMSGPGIKKGLRMERTSRLVDIVPTVCYLLQWPVPEHAEGSVLYQALKDPNAMVEEISKLKAGLARMETALQRGGRQPWDKHECA
jgi:predicted AlkP superfamily phosphohydrolase/phosphomutase